MTSGMEDTDEIPRSYATENNPSSLEDGDIASDCTSSVHTGSSTPNYLKWTQSFSALISDREGYALFDKYTIYENCNPSLKFFSAFNGVKRNNNLTTLSAIYKTYFTKAGALGCYGIRDKTRKAVIKYYNKVNGSIKDYRIFELAFKEVEEYMVKVVHPNFLQSDLYLTYVQKKQAGIKTPSEESRGSISPESSAATLSNGQNSNVISSKDELPIVWTKPQSKSSASAYLQPYSMDSIPEGSCACPEQVNDNYASQPVNPYAVYSSYVPVTAQTSEKASMSSDRSGESRANYLLEKKKEEKNLLELASQNRDTNHLEFIPRIDMGRPRQNNVTASNKQEFAAYLIEKLEQLRKSQEEEEQELCNDQTVQDILDHHCSRLWPLPPFPEENSFSTPLQYPTLSPSINNHNISVGLSQKMASGMGRKSSRTSANFSHRRNMPQNDKHFQNPVPVRDMEKLKLKDPKRMPSSSRTRHEPTSNHRCIGGSFSHNATAAWDTNQFNATNSIKREESLGMKFPDKNFDSSGLSKRQPVPLEQTVAVYRFPPETERYKVKIPGKNITLRQFKSVINKKGKFRYFFKKVDHEFGAGGINEEFNDDSAICPLWEGKIYAIVESMD